MPSHEVYFSFLFAVRARVSWWDTSQCHSHAARGHQECHWGWGQVKVRLGQGPTSVSGLGGLRSSRTELWGAGDKSCCGVGKLGRDRKS